jgi:hypothetical protein
MTTTQQPAPELSSVYTSKDNSRRKDLNFLLELVTAFEQRNRGDRNAEVCPNKTDTARLRRLVEDEIRIDSFVVAFEQASGGFTILPSAGDLNFAAQDLEARAHQLETGIYNFPANTTPASLALSCREVAARLRRAASQTFTAGVDVLDGRTNVSIAGATLTAADRMERLRKALLDIACKPSVYTREEMIDCAVNALSEDGYGA